jgi:eukaryotic-like serine/threonine-protein kinase
LEKTRQWERVKELFDAALQREPGEREDFLKSACGPDDSLREEVRSLLSAYVESGGLSQPFISADLPPEAHADQLIGPYRLVRMLGEGGMGQVWLAEQTEPLRRQVALKLIRTAVYDSSLLARFLAERQSLALMEHPAIAKVFDAGATPEGQPYLVMEYVHGEPITKYCDAKKLNLRDRLELFIKACEGVQHAHQKAIIHRDLKPANILVIEVDGVPTPRIIDFGLARAIELQPGAAEAETVAGTPGYMSPEQAAGSDIDTRTDVYSLGVVLYELLTGQTPFRAEDWRDLPLAQALERAQSQKTLRPSAKAAEKSAAAIQAAEQRQCRSGRLASQLAGDLDLIALKALEKERQKRYGTPSELAADVRHYLRHEPVEAHPPSLTYHLRRYARRHRVGVAMAALLVLLLVGFAALQALQLRRIARERDRANRITDFMTGMFKVSNPSEAHGNQVTAREILDKASGNIGAGLSQDPALQAQLMAVMGAVYENLGIYDRAQTLYSQATDIDRRLEGAEGDDTLKEQALLAWMEYRRGKYADAEKTLRQVLAIRERRSGTRNASTMTVMDYLGAVLNEEGHSREAETMLREVVAFRQRTLGSANPDTLVAMNHLALALQGEGRWSEAEPLDREEVVLWRQVEGADSERGLFAADNLAIILYREGRLAEAETLDRQTLEDKRRILGPDHPETVRSMNTLAAVLTDEGKLNEAKALAEQVVAIRTRVLGPDHPLTFSAMSNVGEVLTRLGDYDAAERILKQSREGEIRVLGLDDPKTALSTYNLACLELKRGRRDQALQLLREAIDHGLFHWVVAEMPTDPDLAPLHGDPRFAALLQYAEAHSAPAQAK